MNRILIVDDDPLNRALLEEELSDEGYHVREAEDGEYALGIIQEGRTDLVLLDIMMPRISGMEVLREIRAQHSVADLPVIMVTAKHQSDDIVQALNEGANDYVVKPIDFPVLLARVRTHLSLKRLSQQKDEFMSIASHDLKNSLTSIIGLVRIIENIPGNDALAKENLPGFVANIKESAKEMYDLIVDFLDFHAVEDGHLVVNRERVDLNQIAERSVRGARDYARDKDINIVADLEQGLEHIEADGSRIKQALDNFVSNAIKFCPNGSRVVVRTRSGERETLVEVSDNGPGLTELDMKRTFVKYATLSNLPTGGEKSFGLGLALCKQVIELHDGTVGVRNNPEGGATFWFTIPGN